MGFVEILVSFGIFIIKWFVDFSLLFFGIAKQNCIDK